MIEIFLKAIDKLTDPLAIIVLLQMLVIIILARAIVKHLPELNRTLGRQATILEHLVYNQSQEDDQ